jgi:hypothetical protein
MINLPLLGQLGTEGIKEQRESLDFVAESLQPIGVKSAFTSHGV